MRLEEPLHCLVMPTKGALCISIALHGTLLAAMAYLNCSPPEAPPLAGGGGLGVIEVLIRNWAVEKEAQVALSPSQTPPSQAAEPRREESKEEKGETGIQTGRDADVESGSVATNPLDSPEEEPGCFSVDSSRLEEPSSEEPESQQSTDSFPAKPAMAETSVKPGAEEKSSKSRASERPIKQETAVTLQVHPQSIPAPAELDPEAKGGPGTEAPGLEGAEALQPVYPLTCRRLGHQGIAVVKVLVGLDGSPLNVEISRSAGCEELDHAALDAVKRARFRPARRWGTPVVSTVLQAFKFELRR